MSEGRYVLRDVELRGDKVAELLGLASGDGDDQESNDSAGSNLTVCRATVRRLAVVLSLRDSEEKNTTSTSATIGNASGTASNGARQYHRSESAPASISSTLSSTISRTARLGTLGGGVSLIATVEIDGLEVDLVPVPTVTRPTSTRQKTDSDRRISSNTHAQFTGSTLPSSSSADQDEDDGNKLAGGGGLLASYVDAAMKSLRLSAELTHMRLRILSRKSATDDAPWVGVRLQSLKYHDLTIEDKAMSASGAPVLRKEVEFNGLAFAVGGMKEANVLFEGGTNASIKDVVATGVRNETQTIAEMKGSGDIKILAHAITASNSVDKSSSVSIANASMKKNSNTMKGEIFRLRNDIDFRLGDSRFDLCLDRSSLEHVSTVVHAINAPPVNGFIDDAATDEEDNLKSNEDAFFDEASDAKALSDMMRQYAEARHLARTQQIRGGIMLPSGDDDGFDTFFDANDQSFCAYRSMMEDSALSERAGLDDFVHTRVTFGFFETTLKVIWGSSESEYVSLTVGEIKATATQSVAESTLNLALSYLEVEDSYEKRDANGRTITDVGNILRFVDDGASEARQTSDEGCVLSSSPCLSLNFSQKDVGKDRTDTNIVLFLHTLEVTHRPSIHSVISSLQSLSEHATNATKEDNATKEGSRQKSPRHQSVVRDPATSQSPNTLQCAIHIPTVTVFMPLATGCGFDQNGLFDRCGYTVPKLSGCESTSIGLVFSDVVLDISNDVVVPETNTNDCAIAIGDSANEGSVGIKTTSVSCQNSVLFVATPVRVSSGRSFRIVDICAISSESSIEANSVIKVQYSERISLNETDKESMGQTKPLCQKGNFPLVPPLSAVKAQQQFEADEVDDIYRTNESGVSVPVPAGSTASLKITDPQYAMSAETNACDTNIEVQVPSLVVDLGQKEISCLVHLFESFSSGNSEKGGTEDSVDTLDQRDVVDGAGPIIRPKEGTGVAFSFDQISIALHGNAEGTHSPPAYVAILDRAKVHVLATPSGGIRHTRLLLQDVTLYEANGLGLSSSIESMEAADASLALTARCMEVRRRGMRSSVASNARPLCYRSKLSRPLSPETPAVIFDVINRSYAAGDFDDEDDEDEREIHLLVYDVTCRYDSSFDPSTLSSILSFGDSEAEQQDDCSDTKHQSSSSDASSSLTNLFVTFSDCALDYSSPDSFVRASRCLVRVSEVRASSNVVSPPGLFQAYKLSMGDVSVHLASARFPYNAENILLSCSKTILDPQDLLVGSMASSDNRGGAFPINNAIPIDATLRRMKFIQIATLDSIDALIVISNSNSPQASDLHANGNIKKEESSGRRPNTAATLSLGQMNLYACQDSFNCFTEVIGEWVFHYTTPSPDQIEEIKASLDRTVIDDTEKSQNKRSVSMPPTGTNTASSRDDSVLERIDDDMFVGKTGNMKRDEAAVVDDDDDLFSSFDELPPPSTGLNGFEGTPSFTEDEDEWLAVDYEWSNDTSIPPGKDQAARWLSTSASSPDNDAHKGMRQRPAAPLMRPNVALRGKSTNNVKIVPQHVPIQALSDPLSTGDMEAAKFAGTETAPPVDTRIIIKDCSVNLRFFDGYDWPELQEQKNKAGSNAAKKDAVDRKSKLLSELLQNDEDETESSCQGSDALTSRQNGSTEHQSPSIKFEPRQASKFFQLTGQKMRLRIDTFEESSNHRLGSCMDLSLNDLFLAETISGDKPVKILGEWFNEAEHPRDTGDGILMMKMVSMHPVNQISADGKFMSDESRVTMELLPLRFFVYQTALRFIRDFFCGPAADGNGDGDSESRGQDCDTATSSTASNQPPPIEDSGNDEILVSPTFFHSFKMRPSKLKVDYRPERLDTTALRDGSYVELVNLLPLEEMVLTLKPVEIRNLTGWGSVFGEIARCWIEDICATQMHKFLTKSRPFQPFSSVGSASKDLVMIPLQEYKQDGNIIKGIRDSTSALAGTVAYEALNTSAKVTRYAANRLSGISRGGKPSDYSSSSGESRMIVSLPSRPDEVPSSFVDVSSHAFDSLTAGLREANYKIVYIPYKEYRRKGASGAAKSVVRGIPVAVRAPLSGASEALSYTLLGVRNQLRPDMMKEEKANLRGLSSDF